MDFVLSNPGTRRNPAAILLGNPRPSKKTGHKKAAPMAKKKRSAAQKAATAKLVALNRAKRKGSKPRTSRKAKASKPRKTSKRRKGSKRKASKKLVRSMTVSVPKGRVNVKIRRVRRAKRKAHKRRGKIVRTIALNPALSLKGFLAPITGVVANLKASMSSAAGIAGVAGGAIGAVAGGTLLARTTMPLAMKLAPGFATSPMGARALAVLNYYGAGFLLARFLPVSDKIKRGILAGAVAAAVIEVIRPGTVQGAVAKVPFIGPLVAGNLAGIEPELGSYVEQAMSGLGLTTNEAGGAMGAYELGDDMGAYELGDDGLEGLGCAPAAQELVSYT
jgi:hypothetical protein